MFRNKKDVDKHVQDVLAKFPNETARVSKHLSFAQQYFNVGEYESAKRYVTSYLTAKDDSPAAHKLYAQCLEKLGNKENALTEYKRSIQLNSKQPELVLKVCELLSEDGFTVDLEQATYWCELGANQFPYHPAIFALKKKLNQLVDEADPASVEALILSELEIRPDDHSLHVQLLKLFVENSRISEAYNYAFNTRLSFIPSLEWYEYCVKICKIYKSKFPEDIGEEFYCNNLLALDRLLALSLQDIKCTVKSIPECTTILSRFDESLSQAFSVASKSENFKDALNHMCGQLCFYTTLILYRKAKWDESVAEEVQQLVPPLLLLSASDTFKMTYTKSNVSSRLDDLLELFVSHGIYRVSQVGFMLRSISENSLKSYAMKVVRGCVSNKWRDKIVQILYSSMEFKQFVSSSFFKNSDQFATIPSAVEFEFKENISVAIRTTEIIHPSSLHHLVWLGTQFIKSKGVKSIMSYSLPSDFHVSKIKNLQFSTNRLNSASVESLCLLDMDAFLYACIYGTTSVILQQFKTMNLYQLPADICKILCSPEQDQWWEYAHQLASNKIPELLFARARAAVHHGLEVIRVIGQSILPLPILVLLARTFAARAKGSDGKEKTEALMERASIYWKAALPLLDQVAAGKLCMKNTKSMFEYYGSIGRREAIPLVNEGNVFLGMLYYKNDQNVGVPDTDIWTSNLQKLYYSSLVRKNLAENSLSSVVVTEEENAKIRDHLIGARSDLRNILERLGVEKTEYFTAQDICDNLKNIDEMLKDLGFTESTTSTPKSASENNLLLMKDPQDTALSGVIKTVTEQNAEILDKIDILFNKHELLCSNQMQLLETVSLLGKRILDIQSDMCTLKQTKLETPRADGIVDSGAAVQPPSVAPNVPVSVVNEPFAQIIIPNSASVAPPILIPNPVSSASQILIPNPASSASQILISNPASAESQFLISNSSSTAYSMYPVLPSVIPPSTVAKYFTPFTQSDAINLGFHTSYTPSTAPALPAYCQSSYFSMNTSSYQTSGGRSAAPISTAPEIRIGTITKMSTPAIQTVLPLQTRTKNDGPVTEPFLQTIPGTSPLPAWTANAASNATSLPWSSYRQTSSPFGTPERASSDINMTSVAPEQILPETNSTFGTPVQILPKVNMGFGTPELTTPKINDAALPTIAAISASTALKTKPLLSSPKFSFSMTESPQTTVTHVTPTTVPHVTPTTVTHVTPTAMTRVTPTTATHVTPKITPDKKTSPAVDSSFYQESDHDPIPDFQPIIPLPEEVAVKTGEENEVILYENRVKLYRFVDKEWKERGVGSYKILEHPETGKIRVTMRRDVVHKVCANHYLTSDMTLTSMVNSDKAWIYCALDFSGEMQAEKFCVKFKNADEAKAFRVVFDDCKIKGEKEEVKPEILEVKSQVSEVKQGVPKMKQPVPKVKQEELKVKQEVPKVKQEVAIEKQIKADPLSAESAKTGLIAPPAFSFGQPKENVGGFTFSMKPSIAQSFAEPPKLVEDRPSPFASFNAFQTTTQQNDVKSNFFENVSNTIDFSTLSKVATEKPAFSKDTNFKGFEGAGTLVFGSTMKTTPAQSPQVSSSPMAASPAVSATDKSPGKGKGEEDEFVPTAEFTPVIPLPELVEVKTGEEGLEVLHEIRCKLFRWVDGEWKERGIGNMKILLDPDTASARLLMRREQVHKLCCNQRLTSALELKPMNSSDKAWTWYGQDYSEGELKEEMFAIRFKTSQQAVEFKDCWDSTKMRQKEQPSQTSVPAAPSVPDTNKAPLSTLFKRDATSWECTMCYVVNKQNANSCVSCGSANPSAPKVESSKSDSEGVKNSLSSSTFSFGTALPTTETAPTSIFSTAPPNKPFTFGSVSSTSGGNTTFSFGSSKPLFSFGNKPGDDNLSIPFATSFSNSSISGNGSSKPLFSFGSKPSDDKPPVFGNLGTPFVSSSNSSSTSGMLFGNLSSPFGSQSDSTNSSSKTKPFEISSAFPSLSGTSGGFGSFLSNTKSTDEKKETEMKSLPERVPVVLMDNNETTLFNQHGTLSKQNGPVWEERGTGEFYVFKHDVSGKVRFLMLREPVQMACLTHYVDKDFTMKMVDGKTWEWTADDFSEGEVISTTFRMKFIDDGTASRFKAVVDGVLEDSRKPSKSETSDEVVYVCETQVPAEEVKQAESLKLPSKYFAYKYNDSSNNSEQNDGEIVLNFPKAEECLDVLTLDEDSEMLVRKIVDSLNTSDNTAEENKEFGAATTSEAGIASTSAEYLTETSTSSSSFSFAALPLKSAPAEVTSNADTSLAGPSGSGGSIFTGTGKNWFPAEQTFNFGSIFDKVIETQLAKNDGKEIRTDISAEEEIKLTEDALVRREQDGQWHERGKGKLHILYQPSDNCYRLFLKDEKNGHILLNMQLNKFSKFSKLSDNDLSIYWYGLNQSEGLTEPTMEKLSLQFFTKNAKKNFDTISSDCLSSLKSGGSAKKPSNDDYGDDYSFNVNDEAQSESNDPEYNYDHFVDQQGLVEAMADLENSHVLYQDTGTLTVETDDSSVSYEGVVAVVREIADNQLITHLVFSTEDIETLFETEIGLDLEFVKKGCERILLLDDDKKISFMFSSKRNAKEFDVMIEDVKDGMYEYGAVGADSDDGSSTEED